MRIEVNRARCVGLGVCESLSPEHFEVGDDGVLVLRDDSVSADAVETIEEAVRSCPTASLTLISRSEQAGA